MRDLQLSVLDPTGHVEQSQDNTRRRLGAALRRLTGRGLTAVLKGMDAEQLKALPPPDKDASATVDAEGAAVSAEDHARAALRQELQALRTFALQQRAAQDGIAESEIEDAMDGDDPRELLIKILLDHHLS